MTALALTRAAGRRVLRSRSTVFFLVVLPVLIILIIGSTLRGFGEFRIGVVVEPGAGSLGADLQADLQAADGLEVRSFDDVDVARTALRRSELVVLVVIPAGFDAQLRAGDTATLPVFADQASTTQQAALAAVAAVVETSAGEVQAAVFAQQQAGAPLDTTLALARDPQAGATPVEVRTDVVDDSSDVLPEGFSYSAPTMLVLFVFINAMAGGAAMIQSRQLGIYARMLAGPVRPRSVVLGETVLYFAMAMLQSLIIVGLGALLFGVDWGDPLAAGLLVTAWALVGTGAGMLSGTLFRTVEQAGAIGPALGMAFGMLGGCMWPLAIVPPVMATVGHLVPHAWAVEAWTELLSRGGDVASIALPLAVLAAFAAGLLALASARLRHQLR